MKMNIIKKMAGAAMIASLTISAQFGSITTYAAETTTLTTPADLEEDEFTGDLEIVDGEKQIKINIGILRDAYNALVDYVDSLRKRLFEEVEERAMDADIPAYDWSDENGTVKLTITIPKTAKSSTGHGSAENDKKYDKHEPSNN